MEVLQGTQHIVFRLIFSITTASLLSLTVLAQSECKSANTSPDDYFPFDPSPTNTSIRAMDPRNAIFIVNDRSIYFSKAQTKMIDQAIQEVRKSIDLLEQTNLIPDKDERIIDALNDLGALYYIKHNYQQSQSCFQGALRKLRGRLGNDVKMAQIYQQLAQVFRAQNKFEEAKTAYRKSIDILNNCSEATIRMQSAAAHHLRLTHSEAGTSKDAAECADIASKVKSVPRPIPTSINVKPFNEVSNITSKARRTIAEVEQAIALDRQRQDQLRMQRAEEERRLKLAELQHRISALRNQKNHDSDDDLYTEEAPGVATISGKAFIPSDQSETTFISTRVTSKQEKLSIEKKDEQEKKSDQILAIQDILLCKYEVREALVRKLLKITVDKGVQVGDLGNKWPIISSQAKDLLREVGAEALLYRIRRHGQPIVAHLTEGMVGSDESKPLRGYTGEYEIRDVPVGNYFIYAQLITAKRAVYWLIRVTITRKEPIQLDIVLDNVSKVIWESDAPLKTRQDRK